MSNTAEQRSQYLKLLQIRIDRAASDVQSAATELEAALRELAPLAGAGDDQMITPALEACFERLRAAQQNVLDLRLLLARA
jgi:hypothetical protein